jgi:hypothetical protein
VLMLERSPAMALLLQAALTRWRAAGLEAAERRWSCSRAMRASCSGTWAPPTWCTSTRCTPTAADAARAADLRWLRRTALAASGRAPGRARGEAEDDGARPCSRPPAQPRTGVWSSSGPATTRPLAGVELRPAASAGTPPATISTPAAAPARAVRTPAPPPWCAPAGSPTPTGAAGAPTVAPAPGRWRRRRDAVDEAAPRGTACRRQCAALLRVWGRGVGGWPAGIRTPTDRTKTGCPAIRRRAIVGHECTRAGPAAVRSQAPARSDAGRERERARPPRAGRARRHMAGPQGFEPRPTGPEPVVLPLDDGPSGRPRRYQQRPARVASRRRATAPLHWC